jgi:nucleoside-diphosphate-sugar epimerase
MALPVPSPAILAAGFVAGLIGTGEPGQLDYRRAQDMVQRAWTCDTRPATEDLGWTPAYDLVQGFRDALSWYLDNGWL